MNQENITKGILSGIIDRYISEVAEDPNRSIRKLLDMGERTSDGPTQKICYQMMQKMAEDVSSPYYEMIHHVVTCVSPQTIRQFGINLGHNAWAYASGPLRKLSEDRGIAIPWAVLIDRTPGPDRIPFSAIDGLVDRGRRMEIYAWLLMSADIPAEWDDYAGLFRTHPDSVFGLRVGPQDVSGKVLDEAAGIHNLMFFIDTDLPDWQSLAEELSRRQCLYSAFRTLASEADARDVLSGNWFEELIPCHPLIAFSCTADSCPAETAEAVRSYMWDTRLEQLYPILPSDLISDFLIISRLISHQETFYRVNADGSVSEGEGLSFRSGRLRCEELFTPSDSQQ